MTGSLREQLRAISWLCFVWLSTTCLQAGEASSESEDESIRPPNIVMIAIDDLNDWIGCLDRHSLVQTPHIDRLAKRGVLFTNAHCQAPLCNSSRTSIFSGLRPSTTGVYALAPWFRSSGEFADHVSLPQFMMKHGYETWTGGKIWHGGYPPQKFRQSESSHWGPNASVGARPEKKLVNNTPGGNHPLVDWGTFPHRDQDKGDWKVASWAVDMLESKPKEPFMLNVGFFLPHVPCYATQEWFDLYPDDNRVLPPIKRDDRNDIPDFAWYLHWDLPEPRTSWLQEHRQLQPLSRAYLASISFVDGQVGRVLDALTREGLDERTIVVLWSDHGWHLGEKGISGKNSLWERSTHVPLIFAGPGVAKQGRCQQPVELLDIYPTLAELCGLPVDKGLEGHSVLLQLRDPALERQWPAITTHNRGNHAVRSLRYRYIRYANGDEELYDLLADPHEWTNLVALESYSDVIDDHAKWLPQINVPPMQGSRHRLLEQTDGKWFWEGKPIDPQQAIR